MGISEKAVIRGKEKQIIELAAEAGAKAALEVIKSNTGNIQIWTAGEAYKKTEKRLRNLPILRKKVEYNKEQLIEYENEILRSKSKSIVRFNTSGIRLDQADILDTLKQDVTAQIAAYEREIRLIEDALSIISEEEYYKAVYNRLCLGETDEEIARKIPCNSVATVRKNRGKLMQKLVVWFYGEGTF